TAVAAYIVKPVRRQPRLGAMFVDHVLRLQISWDGRFLARAPMVLGPCAGLTLSDRSDRITVPLRRRPAKAPPPPMPSPPRPSCLRDVRRGRSASPDRLSRSLIHRSHEPQ